MFCPIVQTYLAIPSHSSSVEHPGEVRRRGRTVVREPPSASRSLVQCDEPMSLPNGPRDWAWRGLRTCFLQLRCNSCKNAATAASMLPTAATMPAGDRRGRRWRRGLRYCTAECQREFNKVEPSALVPHFNSNQGDR
jgi:hypothetical protein